MSKLEPRILSAPNGRRGYLSQIAHDGQTAWAVGGRAYDITVMATSDGATWHSRAVPDRGLRGILMRDDDIVVIGEYGHVAISSDLGESFEVIQDDGEGCLFSIGQGDGCAWIVGDHGRLLRLEGREITSVDSGTSARLNAVIPMDGGLWLLGFDNVLRSHDGTASTEVLTGSAPFTDLVKTPTGALILSGDRGQLLRSDDGGRTFTPAEHPSAEDLEAVTCTADGIVVVVGGGALVMVSEDDGRTFQKVDLGLTGHPSLWCVTPFGAGVLIGGDDGLVVSLAPPGDAPWEGRDDRFHVDHPLDAVFAPGPDGFLEERLRAFVRVANPGIDEVPEPADPVEATEPEEDDEDEDEDEPALQGADAWKTAAWKIAQHLWTGFASDHEAVWGVEPPAQLVAFQNAVNGANPWSTFEELRLDCRQMGNPDAALNLFEMVVLSDQLNYLGTALPEAFTGVVCYGSLGNGDTYHLQVYDNGQGHVVQFWNHETHDFEWAFATDLESAVYLSALCKAVDDEAISDAVAAQGFASLHGRVAPSWHFSMDRRDADFEEYAHPDDAQFTQYMLYRASWIIGLLRSDGVTQVSDLAQRFHANLNPVLPDELVEPRRQAVTEFVPTALYAMWRAYLFDEPELDTYLELSRNHAGRLARDCAALIDELRGGRKVLGRIEDWPRLLERFRALDLDPRRAAEREAEEAAKAADAEARAGALVETLASLEGDAEADFLWTHIREGAARPAFLAHVLADPRRDAAKQGLEFLMDQGYSRDNSLYRSEEHEATAWVGAHADSALEAILAGQALYGVSLEDGVRLPGAQHCWAALTTRARADQLDARILPHVREWLAAQTLEEDPSWLMARYLELVTASRDARCVDPLLALLERVPHEGGFETSLKYDDFVGEVCDALRAIGESRAAPALVRFAGSPALRMRDARVGAARALAKLAPELGTAAICTTLIEMTTQINDCPENSQSLLAVALFAPHLSGADRDAVRQTLLDSEPMAKSYVEVALARGFALRQLGDTSALAERVEELMAQMLLEPAWKHEYTVRRGHFALDAMEAGVFASPSLVEGLATLGDAALNARLATHVDIAPPRSITWFDTAAMTPSELIDAVFDPRLHGRAHAARRLGLTPDPAARKALETACHEILTIAPDNPGADLSPAQGRLLKESVIALLALPEAGSTTQLFDAMLRQSVRDIKGPLLRRAPAIKALAPAMQAVAAEKWGWQEKAARSWLDAHG